MFSLILLWTGAVIRLFRSRGNLVLENLVLRQQLAVLKRRHRRPSIGLLDKLFWVVVRKSRPLAADEPRSDRLRHCPANAGVFGADVGDSSCECYGRCWASTESRTD